MIRLVVSNPFSPPPPPTPTPQEVRAAAEAKHLELPISEFDFKISEKHGANISIWPYRRRTWSMTFLAVCGEAEDMYVQRIVSGHPTRLAAFDHAVASIRRACVVQSGKYPVNAAAVLRWLESLEAPL